MNIPSQLEEELDEQMDDLAKEVAYNGIPESTFTITAVQEFLEAVKRIRKRLGLYAPREH